MHPWLADLTQRRHRCVSGGRRRQLGIPSVCDAGRTGSTSGTSARRARSRFWAHRVCADADVAPVPGNDVRGAGSGGNVDAHRAPAVRQSRTVPTAPSRGSRKLAGPCGGHLVGARRRGDAGIRRHVAGACHDRPRPGACRPASDRISLSRNGCSAADDFGIHAPAARSEHQLAQSGDQPRRHRRGMRSNAG